MLVISELTSQLCEHDHQPEAMHMVCEQEFHHYQVDRESEDDYDDYPPRDVETSPVQYDGDGRLWFCRESSDDKW